MFGKRIEIGRRDFVRHSVGMGAGVAALGRLPEAMTRRSQPFGEGAGGICKDIHRTEH